MVAIKLLVLLVLVLLLLLMLMRGQLLALDWFTCKLVSCTKREQRLRAEGSS
jgi:hypothetical protein